MFFQTEMLVQFFRNYILNSPFWLMQHQSNKPGFLSEIGGGLRGGRVCTWTQLQVSWLWDTLPPSGAAGA